jgi:heme oxygenase
MGPLRDATLDLHHAAERHPVGQAMADGTISERWWLDWLGALRVVHATLDPHLPAVLHRIHQIDADIAAMAPMQPAVGHAPRLFAQSLTTHLAVTGAAYVFTGAHLFGGALTARAVGSRLPSSHLLWVDRPAALHVFRPMRNAIEAELYARNAFAAVLAIMDGIVGDD